MSMETPKRKHPYDGLLGSQNADQGTQEKPEAKYASVPFDMSDQEILAAQEQVFGEGNYPGPDKDKLNATMSSLRKKGDEGQRKAA